MTIFATQKPQTQVKTMLAGPFGQGLEMYIDIYDKFLKENGFTENMPQYLYHYTNSEALINIIENNEFWLTHVQFFNDKNEYYEGVNFILEILRRRKNEIGADLLKSLQNVFLGDQYNDRALNVGVLSFSEKRDLLSQWRGYTKHGCGYCLCLETAKLYRQDIHVWFRKCIYLNVEKEKIVNKIVDSILEKQKQGETPEQINAFAFFLFQECAITFKNEAFKEESEWRLITFPLANNDQKWNFRAGAFAIIPYTKITVNLKDCFHEVIIGPSYSQELSKKSLFFLLWKKELNFMAINFSKVPYRMV